MMVILPGILTRKHQYVDNTIVSFVSCLSTLSCLFRDEEEGRVLLCERVCVCVLFLHVCVCLCG